MKNVEKHWSEHKKNTESSNENPVIVIDNGIGVVRQATYELVFSLAQSSPIDFQNTFSQAGTELVPNFTNSKAFNVLGRGEQLYSSAGRIKKELCPQDTFFL